MLNRESKLLHFIDTSVARPMMTGSKKYRDYFNNTFTGKRYISNYVYMEFMSGFIVAIIEFYYCLALDSVETLDDAMSLWSQRFSGREVKAVLSVASSIAKLREYDASKAEDKEKLLYALADYVTRLVTVFMGKFTVDGQDATQCKRAEVPFNVNPDRAKEDFRNYLDQFNDLKQCRSRCNIGAFLTERHAHSIKRYQELANNQQRQNEEGFIKVIVNLTKILKKDISQCTCIQCSKVGDAIIALDLPDQMRLEHTDRSYNLLCDVINKPHFLHLSEVACMGPTPTPRPATTDN